MFFSPLALSTLLLSSTAFAHCKGHHKRRNCKNGPNSRDCWSNGFDVNCDYDKSWPKTGKTVNYDFHITQQTGGVAGSKASLDGHQQPVLLVNGQYPGPTIEANWGDTVQVTVYNDLNSWNNGTSIHWHGMRQYHTNTQDGTNGITECPLAPGDKKTYKFVANQYGTSWYHSHYSIQYADGLVGPIVIHGPASANYDIDLGPVMLTDWFYTEAFKLYDQAKVAPGPPTADNVLINGKMVSNGGAAGSYYTATLTPGKKHLVRFVNSGINDYFHLKLDGHQFQVVAADFVPVTPFYTDELVLGVGQRYDVIIKANATVDNYWLHVGTGNGGQFSLPANPPCDGPLATEGQVKAIFRYNGAPNANPAATGSGNLTAGCEDLPHALTPIQKKNVPAPSKGVNEDFEIGFKPADTSVAGQFVTWLVNDSAININWGTPTLKYVQDGNTSYPSSDNVFTLDVAADTWTYWVLHQDPNNPPLPHPIHLHGHDFWVLAQGDGVWDGTFTTLKNPTRRDTASLPAAGHLVLAFPADNPGAWLMHCHIPFHISGGLGLQFLERPKEILKTVSGLDGVTDYCKKWDTYQAGAKAVVQDDSGL